MRRPPSVGRPSRRRTVLVALLVAVLATCVALVLAQSAGLIDLPVLGQANGQPGAAPPGAGGVLRVAPGRAGPPYSPAKRSSSSTSVASTWLRAST